MGFRRLKVIALGLVLVTGGLAACTTEPPPDPAAPWVGTWGGTVDQDGFTYPMTMVLENGDAGLEGTVDFPSLPCSGTLTEPSLSGSELVMTETITSSGGICVPVTTWTFTKDGADIILGSNVGGGVTATATLTKQAPWVGTWSGMVDQGGDTYPMTMVLENGDAGLEGTVDFPSLPCSGTLTEPSLSGSELVMTETITSSGGICVPVTTWTFTQDGADIILGSNVGGGVTATATLERQN